MPLSERLTLLGHWTWFLLRTLGPSLAALPRFKSWLKPFDEIVIGGWPLAIVLGCALGAVTWMHTRGVLERTAGATELLPTVLAAAVLLELAPVGAGLIVAARTGANLGAELGAMRVSEQIEAVAMMGQSPIHHLIAPRIVACILAVPCVYLLVAGLAIGSGYFAELTSGSMSWLRYERAIFQELNIQEVLPAALKTIVFGWLIGVTGCFVGLQANGGSEGVGRATTTSVVACCLQVLVADVILVALIRLLVA